MTEYEEYDEYEHDDSELNFDKNIIEILELVDEV